APAEDTPGVARSALSIWPMAASTVHGSPRQDCAGDSWNSWMELAGRPDGTRLVATGGGACCGRNVISDAPLPASAVLTSCLTFCTLGRGAPPGAVALWISPGVAQTLLLTKTCMPAMPSRAAPANYRLTVP